MKQEISDGKFFKFLRENKIVTEKKQLDEMYKQCIFVSKKDQNKRIQEGHTVSLALFQRLFEKPLLLIAMENALSLLEASVIEKNKDANYLSKKLQMESKWPEMDKTSLGQTVAIVGFQREYMKQVFQSDELEAFDKFKKEAKRIKK